MIPWWYLLLGLVGLGVLVFLLGVVGLYLNQHASRTKLPIPPSTTDDVLRKRYH